MTLPHQPIALVSSENEARVQADIPVHQSDELFRLLVESVKDYAIFLLDPNGRVITWNQGAERIKGYKANEIIGQHFSRFYPQEAIESKWPERELEIASKEGRFADEGLRVRKDGSTFWANVVINPLFDFHGRLRGFSKVTRDLTERRALEERSRQLNKELRSRVTQLMESQRLVELRTLELQKLSTELMRVQDAERRRISRSLHDDLGQDLAALKLELDIRHKSEEAERESRLRAIKLTDEALSKVRNVSYLLHPPLLDETGLLPALLWYLDGLKRRSEIRIRFDYKPVVFPRLPGEIETTIFRIIQESLTNVYRHSESKDVRIDMNQELESVTIRVRDFGKGIGDPTTSPIGVGISSMKERAKQLNGELRVLRSEPGTVVEATIPLSDSVGTPLL